jgi:thiamine-phosphate pyrophosphorylase
MTCLVTDRRQLTGTADLTDRGRRCLVDQAQHAADAGVDIVQVRERDLPAAALAALVRDLLAAVHGTRTRIVVNDRLDVAVACGADGVHLRGDSMPIDAARRLAPDGFAIGKSVHSTEDAIAAAGADYLVAGTVFPTPSKDRSVTLLGVEGLRRIATAVSIPVLGIGGMTEERISEIARSGAAGWAAIGLFMAAATASDGGACRATPLRTLVERARARFDNSENRSLT